MPRVTTSDSYVLNIGDPIDYDPTAWTDLLGYVYGTNITGLPSGFYPYTEYGWWVDVIGPDGWGSSYYYSPVTFINIFAPSVPKDDVSPSISESGWSNHPYKEFNTYPHRPRSYEESQMDDEE